VPRKEDEPRYWSKPTAATTNEHQSSEAGAYGCVNHITAEDAQQAPDVVFGMFLAKSNPTTALFDSGTSHSFISSIFVATHKLPIAAMNRTMLVSSPGGEMKTNVYVQ
jgi:hypothetical protein